MPFGAVVLKPGIDVESTPTASQAGINAGNLIRWKRDAITVYAEKLGGWDRFYPFSLGSVPRELHPWQDLNSNQRLAVGCTQSLNVITNGVNGVLTPQLTTTNSSASFATSTSSPTITVTDTNIANPTTNNFVFINTPVSVSGIVLSGIYAIETIASADSYTITAAQNATGIATGGVVPTYTTSTGSPVVTVNLPNHSYTVGSDYYASVLTTASGIVVSGSYLVQSAGTASFTINASSPATGGATTPENNGNVQFIYYIAIGPQAQSSGYGVGGYGSGGYGTGIAAPTGSGMPITATDWSIDNWGEILLACPQGGGIYQWGPESGFETAQLIPTAPISSLSMFVTMPQQILIALGASFTGAPDPLSVAWSTAGDYTNWTPTSTTFAGAYQIPRGSTLVGGLQAPTQNLLWTDLAVWSMQYINLPLVFGFNEIMSGCGLIGSHAAVLAEGTVFWMSQNQFFAMPAGGGPSPLPCTVWDAVFQNLDMANAFKIRAGANSAFNEIWWHYPSLSSPNGENDSYVKFNLVEQVWDYGMLPTGRSAWIDQSVLGPPLGGDPTGLIFQHEVGYDGDGAALNPFLTTGYWVIDEAEQFSFVDQVIPDFTYGTYAGPQTASPVVTLYSVDYPNGPITTYGPYTVSAAVNQVTTRLRGRQMAMQISSQDSGSFWRLGRTRFRFSSDGRR